MFLIDPKALVHAARMLKRAIASDADLLVVNRFGNAEADGRGMRAEIAAAVRSGAVVLIPVRFSLLNDFEGFLGAPAPVLLPSVVAIADWALYAVKQRMSVASS